MPSDGDIAAFARAGDNLGPLVDGLLTTFGLAEPFVATVTLTSDPAGDVLVGTVGDDLFDARLDTEGPTLGDSDTLDGGGGDDQLLVELLGAGGAPMVMAVETWVITALDNGLLAGGDGQTDSTLDFSRSSGFTQVVNQLSRGDLALVGLGELAAVEWRNMTVGEDFTLAFAAPLLVGDDDILAITLVDNTNAGVFNAGSPGGDGFEIFDLTVVGNNRLVNLGSASDYTLDGPLNNDQLREIRVQGDSPTAQLAIGEILTGLETFDAAAFAGDLRVNFARGDGVQVVGGAGNDTLGFAFAAPDDGAVALAFDGADAVDGGAGFDQILLDQPRLVVEGAPADADLTVAGVEELVLLQLGFADDGASAVDPTLDGFYDLERLGAGRGDLVRVVLDGWDGDDRVAIVNGPTGLALGLESSLAEVEVTIPAAQDPGPMDDVLVVDLLGDLTLGALVADGTEGFVLNNRGSNQAFIRGDPFTSLTITGTGALVFVGEMGEALGGTTLAVLDAAAFDGDLTVTVGDGVGGGVDPFAVEASDTGVVVTGGAGRDGVVAGANNDTLAGGAGDDRLTGSLGADVITGGPGADVFVYTSVQESTLAGTTASFFAGDTLLDVDAAVDRFDISAFLDAPGAAAIGNLTIASSSQGDLASALGGLAITAPINLVTVGAGGATGTYLAIDTDGDGSLADDFVVRLQGLQGSLGEASFIVGNGPGNPPFITPGQSFVIGPTAPLGSVVGTVAVFDDFDQVVALEITGGNGDTDGDGTAAFAIDLDGTLQIADPDDVAAAAGQTLTLSVTADDATGNRSVATPVAVTVLPVGGDTSPPILTVDDPAVDLALAAVDDGTVVTGVAASDPESGVAALAIDAPGNPDGDGDGTPVFGLLNDQVVVLDADELQGGETFSLTLTATNGVGLTADADLVVNIGPVNPPPPPPAGDNTPPAISVAPTAVTLSVDAVDDGDTVATVSASDAESGVAQLAFVAGNEDGDGDGNRAFTLLANGDVVITDADELDAAENFTLVFRATNGVNLTSSASLRISVQDNSPPSISVVPTATMLIAGSINDGDFVADVAAEDRGSGLSDVTISAGNGDGDGDGLLAFGVLNDQVVVNDADDLMAGDDFVLTLTARNGVNLTADALLTVSVDDISPPLVALIPTATTLGAGDLVAGNVVSAVDASDPESGITSLAITAGNEDEDGDGIDAFVLVGDEIRINDADELNGEAFNLTVTATNGQGLTTSQTLTIDVDDITAPNLTLNPDTVNLSAGDLVNGNAVSTATASDPQSGIATLAITAGNEDEDGDGSNAFTLVGNEIRINDADELNGEVFNLTIAATNGQGIVTNTFLEVTIEDTTAPILTLTPDTFNFSFTIPPSNGAVVSDASALDPESGIANLAIVAGNEDEDQDGNDAFVLVSGEVIVNDADELNGESLNLVIRATNGQGLTTDDILTVNIPDFTPPVVNLIPDTVVLLEGDVISGSTISTFAANDPESGVANRVIFGGNEDEDNDGVAAFGLIGDQVAINDFDELDDEVFTLQLRATNGAGLATSDFLTIIVDDVTPPNLFITPNPVSVSILADNGDVVSNVVAQDLETGASVAITGGNEDEDNDCIESFVLIADQIIIQDDDELETGETFSLEITAVNLIGLETIQQLDITIVIA
ncbi:MAG: beta strand repeat-containing protein [Candidatus Competibacterales bacterium]